MRSMKSALLSLSLLAVAFSPFTQANMRAAISDWQSPSSALKTSADGKVQGLTVTHETLRIDCDHSQCQVDATYSIRAERPEQLRFTFLLPTDGQVQSRINQQDSPASIRMVPPDPHFMETVAARHDMRLYAMHKAEFSGRLEQGSNTVNVRYVQPLSILEARYGYFVSSRFVEHFLYLLGPLKEWDMADDFVLDLQVSTPKKRAKRDAVKIFKRRSIACSLPGGNVTREKGRVIYRNQVGQAFPDNLVCVMGGSDLLSERYFR